VKTLPGAERWHELEDLFQRASDLDLSARSAFLDEACSDDQELRTAVDRLLERADSTLTGLKTSVDKAARELTFTGRRIGSYVLLRVLGEGGMGTVFLAARADNNYVQIVAIKLIHPAFWQSESMLQRFRDERQMLANLSHPNIARLLDGGITPEGSPYLVMEFLDGTPIDEYCRDKCVPLAQKLAIFEKLCSAVEYAHKSLVVHRDIKPANVLVTEEGVPKLLDFGIAKFLDDSNGLNGLGSTRSTARLMTPEYASPEQLKGEPITTATDVYGLGVLLYELLAGRHPFADHRWNPLEMARQICEVDPCAPSAALVDALDAMSQDRRKLHDDLDQIVLMAIRKEPERRYSSPAQLAADVAAYLNGYPVIARHKSRTYRARKFVRRHKVGVLTATLLILTLSSFSVGMGVLKQRAYDERLTAEQDRVMAEHAAAFLAEMFRAATPEEARGRTITARELLDRGASRVDKELGGAPKIRASLLYSIADAYSRLGLYDQAQGLARRSYKLRSLLAPRDAATVESLSLLANVIRLKGQYKEAEPLFREMLQIRTAAFGQDQVRIADTLNSLGECLYLEGKNAEAESKLREALRIYRRESPNLGSGARDHLARLLEDRGDYLEAIQLLKEAVEIDRRAQEYNSPSYTTHLHNLAGARARVGDVFTAEAELRESLDTERHVLGEAHPDLGYPLNLLGVVLLEEGEWQRAEPLLHHSLVLWSKLGQNHPLFVTASANWARLLQAKGKYCEGRSYFDRALATAERSSNPPYYKQWVLSRYASLEFDSGNYSKAEELARRALAIQHDMDGGGTGRDTAQTRIVLAQTLIFRHDPASAETLLRRTLEVLKARLPANYPPVTIAEIRLGEALTAEGRPAVAEPILRQALASAYSPPFRIPAWQVGEAERAFGRCLLALDRKQEAQGLLDQSRKKLAIDRHSVFGGRAAPDLKALLAVREHR
jgi:serine/threonine-protein kinase